MGIENLLNISNINNPIADVIKHEAINSKNDAIDNIKGLFFLDL